MSSSRANRAALFKKPRQRWQLSGDAGGPVPFSVRIVLSENVSFAGCANLLGSSVFMIREHLQMTIQKSRLPAWTGLIRRAPFSKELHLILDRVACHSLKSLVVGAMPRRRKPCNRI